MLKATWRSLRAHKARMLLSGLAVVLGVAFVVGTFIFTDTLEGTFDELFAGETPDVVVTQATDVSVPEGTGTVQSSVPQSVVEQVQATDGVARASGSVQAYGVTLLDATAPPWEATDRRSWESRSPSTRRIPSSAVCRWSRAGSPAAARS